MKIILKTKTLTREKIILKIKTMAKVKMDTNRLIVASPDLNGFKYKSKST